MGVIDKAREYSAGVLSGATPAGPHVRAACRRQERDLKKQTRKTFPYRFDIGLAERVCKFIELMPHTKGEWAATGDLIELQPWQCFVLTTLFGWVRKNSGMRRFREAYLEVPRKNGKSIFAAGIGLYLFVADNEFGAEVYSGATTEKQAWEVFRPAKLMAERADGFTDNFGVQVNAKTLSRASDMSRFEPVIGKPGDGASPNCALIDEYHEHQTPDLYETMLTGMGARKQPLALIITTAGSNVGGPCYQKRDDVIKVLSGVYESDDVFGIIYGLDDGNHDIVIQSSKSIRRMDELCKNRCATTTQIARYVYEACACFVMIDGEEKTELGSALTTQTDQPGQRVCVGHATNNNCSTATQNTKRNRLPKEKNGQTKILTNVGPQSINGDLSQKAKKYLKIIGESVNTDYSQKSTRAGTTSRADDAQFVESTTKASTLTIATILDFLEDSSVINAIPESDFLEIKRKIYNAHSTTCAVRNLKLNADGTLTECRPPDDWTTEEALRKANPNYDVSVSAEFLISQQKKAMQSPALQNAFRTKHLNQWVAARSAFFNALEVERCSEDLNVTDFANETCWIGIDLASKVDITARVMLFKREEHWFAFPKFFIPADTANDEANRMYLAWADGGYIDLTPGSMIDFDYIEEDLRNCAAGHSVKEVPFDPWNASQMAVRMANEGLTMVEYRATVQNFSEPMKQLQALMKAGRFHYQTNPIMTWMFTNVVALLDAKDNVYPRKEFERNKIDGVIALLSALGRALNAGDDDAGSVYDGRGVLTL